MDFLDSYQIETDVFRPYFGRHRYRRSAAYCVYTEFDIRLSYIYPNSKLDLYHYPESSILYEMESDDYERVISLHTFISIASGLFVNLNHLDISYSNSSHIPELPQLRTLNCSYTKVSKLPETLINLETLICASSRVMYVPTTYTNLRHLDIYETFVIELPKEYTLLERLCCAFSLVFEIPPTYTGLTYLNCEFSMVNQIPPSLINLRTIKLN